MPLAEIGLESSGIANTVPSKGEDIKFLCKTLSTDIFKDFIALRPSRFKSGMLVTSIVNLLLPWLPKQTSLSKLPAIGTGCLLANLYYYLGRARRFFRCPWGRVSFGLSILTQIVLLRKLPPVAASSSMDTDLPFISAVSSNFGDLITSEVVVLSSHWRIALSCFLHRRSQRGAKGPWPSPQILKLTCGLQNFWNFWNVLLFTAYYLLF